jgi:hypothetical protein
MKGDILLSQQALTEHKVLPLLPINLVQEKWQYHGQIIPEIMVVRSNGFATTNVNAHMNDLWRYNPTTNEMDLDEGRNVISQLAVYGTKGVSSSTNNRSKIWIIKLYRCFR